MDHRIKVAAVLTVVAAITVVVLTRDVVIAAIGGALVAAGTWLLKEAFD